MIPTVRVVHVCPPIIVQTDISNFQTVVQELTGKRKAYSTHNNMSHHKCHQSNIIVLDSSIDDCNKDPGDSNECHSEDMINDYVGDGINGCRKEEWLLLNDGCLSPNWSTSSSSDNSISQEETSNLVTVCSIEDFSVMNTNQNSTEGGSGMITHMSQSNIQYTATKEINECASPLSNPYNGNFSCRKAKALKSCANQDFLFDQSLVSNNHVLLSNIEHMLFHEENGYGFITPPLSTLDDDKQLLADADHLLQDLYDMDIFPLSA